MTEKTKNAHENRGSAPYVLEVMTRAGVRCLQFLTPVRVALGACGGVAQHRSSPLMRGNRGPWHHRRQGPFFVSAAYRPRYREAVRSQPWPGRM